MSWITRLLWFVLGEYAKMRFVSGLKKRGVVAYLRALQGTRRALIGALLLFFFLQTVMLAGAGAIATGLWLWDADLHLKLQVAFGICLALFVLPVVALIVAFNERLWYRLSGAEKMVDDLTSPNLE